MVFCDDAGRDLPPDRSSQPVNRAKRWFVVPELMDRHRREIAPGRTVLITEGWRVVGMARAPLSPDAKPTA